MSVLDRAKFSRLPETNKLIERMDKLEQGELLSVETIEHIIGRDANDCQSVVSSAIRVLEKDGKHFRFAPKKEGGLKRLTDQDICSRSSNKTKTIHKQSRREIVRLAAVKFESLADADKRKHLTVSAQL